jgi:hypothetical protein
LNRIAMKQYRGYRDPNSERRRFRLSA